MRSFWTKIDALEAWHAKLVDKPWLQPLKPTKFMITLIVLSTLIAAGMNWYVRHWQYQVWEQNPEIFYLDDGTPLFTTTDAPYFLGLAKAIKDEGSIQPFAEKRSYPNALKQQKKETSGSLRNAPLLSVILSKIAGDGSQKAILQAGHSLIPITAFLTAVMIVFAFGAAGHWLPGVFAAAGGPLSFSYLSRSGAGRIDTDQLNLGFFYFMIGLVIFTAKRRPLSGAFILAFVSGAVFWIFDWWYSKPMFGWAFVVGLVWLDLVSHRSLKRTILVASVFICTSGLWAKGIGFDSSSAYLTTDMNFGNFIFRSSLFFKSN